MVGAGAAVAVDSFAFAAVVDDILLVDIVAVASALRAYVAVAAASVVAVEAFAVGISPVV